MALLSWYQHQIKTVSLIDSSKCAESTKPSFPVSYPGSICNLAPVSAVFPSLTRLSLVSCICQQALTMFTMHKLWLAVGAQYWPLIGQSWHRKRGCTLHLSLTSRWCRADSLHYLMSLQIKVSGNHWETEMWRERDWHCDILWAMINWPIRGQCWPMQWEARLWSGWHFRLGVTREGWEDVVESEKMDFIEPGYKYHNIAPADNRIKISPGLRKLNLELTFSTEMF